MTDLSDLTDGDIPPFFREVVERGWSVTPSGGRVLADLCPETFSTYADRIAEETTINGRGMTDYDLPAAPHERTPLLVRRCLAYVWACLRKAHAHFGDTQVTAYVSLSFADTEEALLTSNVTFCTPLPDVRPYIPDVEAVTDAAIAEVTMERQAIPNETHSGQLGILSSLGDYEPAWLAIGHKRVVPVPAGSRVDDALVQRITRGCRTGGADALLVMVLGSETVGRTWRLIAPDVAASELVGVSSPLLLASSDQQGAVLFSRPGYALVAGTAEFLKGAVPEGVDGGRARFGRYARAAAKRWPEFKDISQSFPPRHIAWARAREIPAGTNAARQVKMMQAFAAGSISGADFAREWLDARRASQNDGERLRDPLLAAFDQIFSLLEDYSIDPALKDPGDLSDEELVDAVREVMERTDGFG
ncbi:hypothetical protein [Streptomyces sp. NBC_00525]|uniref:hypothetical protein n=1 Tax=Streptomyces sp. NBC_00525 TaxID=2903660 RepID=UPI002E81D43A|nr:hypothetical protein [Streptomyces sp. NBC_00525]WUC94726.1 colicin immunity domain-containing protein [Streptomyces sp. NBC_00525]